MTSQVNNHLIHYTAAEDSAQPGPASDMTNAESDLGNTGDVAEEDQQSLATQAHRSIAQFASAGDSDPSLPCACFVSRLWRRMADAVGGESTAGRPGPALERGQVALRHSIVLAYFVFDCFFSVKKKFYLFQECAFHFGSVAGKEDGVLARQEEGHVPRVPPGAG